MRDTITRHHALFRGRKATRNNKTDPMQPLRTTLIGLARHAPGKLSPGTPRKIVFPYPQKGGSLCGTGKCPLVSQLLEASGVRLQPGVRVALTCRV